MEMEKQREEKNSSSRWDKNPWPLDHQVWDFLVYFNLFSAFMWSICVAIWTKISNTILNHNHYQTYYNVVVIYNPSMFRRQTGCVIEIISHSKYLAKPGFEPCSHRSVSYWMTTPDPDAWKNVRESEGYQQELWFIAKLTLNRLAWVRKSLQKIIKWPNAMWRGRIAAIFQLQNGLNYNRPWHSGRMQ